mmetsp:Transcript_50504/g.99852  ORF Transcript_50504/g.99852 Transcript_50504/m.99852 type:complete len:200 (-) Transcript_50504:166-765(-)
MAALRARRNKAPSSEDESAAVNDDDAFEASERISVAIIARSTSGLPNPRLRWLSPKGSVYPSAPTESTCHVGKPSREGVRATIAAGAWPNDARNSFASWKLELVDMSVYDKPSAYTVAVTAAASSTASTLFASWPAASRRTLVSFKYMAPWSHKMSCTARSTSRAVSLFSCQNVMAQKAAPLHSQGVQLLPFHRAQPPP